MFQRGTPASPLPSAWTAQIPIDKLKLELDSVPSFTIAKNSSTGRRFNDDQIKFLESMYEEEERPELRVKQQLANKLGLLPRQVAIWFQNKRARSKSKQIEQQYNILKSSYDDLSSKFQSLNKEYESLLIQAQRLRQLNDRGDKEDNIKLATNEMPKFLLETSSHKLFKTATQNYNEKADYLGEQTYALHLAQTIDGCLTSAEGKSSFQTNDLLENPSCSTQWWEF